MDEDEGRSIGNGDELKRHDRQRNGKKRGHARDIQSQRIILYLKKKN